ncbi:MAG: hypothetical protein HRT94_03395 [Alphaproteobacteria bacterium]|nr:hypothetical protein [Alphaproteobacteria bacterium]
MLNRKNITLTVLSVLALGACTQNSPSMMNTSPVELQKQTVIEQIPLNQINDVLISALADDYQKLGSGVLELTMAFDPKSKTFTAMNALNKLKEVKTKLARKGVRSVVTETLAVEGAQPMLMVSFDTVQAQAPSDCETMPGLEVNKTTRFIDEYKFGCSVETMLARQIARPSDLEGVDGLDNQDGGRRETNIVDAYAAGAPQPALNTIGRGDLGSQ